MNRFRVSLVAVCVFIVLASAFLSSFVISVSGSSVIAQTLIWKQTMPKYSVTDYDFHNNHWSYNVSQPFGQPTIVNGVLYVGNSGGERQGPDRGIYAYDASNGQKLWNYSVEYDTYSSLKVVDGVVYVGSNSGLFALDALDGRKLWNCSESSELIKTSYGSYSPIYNAMFFASPEVSDGFVYDVSYDANLIAFESANGAIVWNYTIQKGQYYPAYGTFTSPIISNGILYVGCQDHNVYALSASNGDRIWNFSTRGEVYAPLTVLDNIVYVSSYDGNVYALDAANGRKIWSFKVNLDSAGMGFIDSKPVVVDSVVYVGCENGLLYALRRDDGTELWRFNATRQIRSSPSIQDGYVYFGTETGNLYALNTESGRLIWNYTTDGGVVYPTVSNGILYVGTEAGSIYAIGSTLFGGSLSVPEIIVAVTISIVAVLSIVIFIKKHHRKAALSMPTTV